MGNRNEAIVFHNTAKLNGFLWFWGLRENVLFRAKWSEGYAHVVNLRCYEAKRNTGSLYGKIEKYENKLIGVPLASDEILIYDCQTGIDNYVSLPKNIFGEEFVDRGKFWDVVICDNDAYFIGYWSNKILKFDLLHEKISKIIELNIENSRFSKDIFFKKAGLYRDCLIVPACQKNIVYVIDKDSMEYRIKEFKGTKEGFSALLIDGSDIWLAPRRNGKFIRWNPELDHAEYLDYPVICSSAKPSYGFLAKTENDILAFPLHAKGVLRINPETLKAYIDPKLTEICRENNGQVQKTGFIEIEGKKIIIYSWLEGSFYNYNTKTGIIQKNEIRYAEDYYIFMMKKEWEKNGYIDEGNCSLDIFIHNIDKLKRSGTDE